ncbi:ladderlectin-like [Oreochromis aureus]|uniref:C-type lectin domain-containing protein n=1 Tax=Oreochromis aureus TaxID=47969 RepID=A0AAZ1WZC0_OREAU|nr:ladderlectin-like [Oreochromis aureus]
MKLVVVSALLCAMLALITAADPPAKQHVEKRTYCTCARYSGWTKYGNRNYRYINTPMTWAQAQRYCQYMNANLASVHNLWEYRMIQRVIYYATHTYKTTWIGGSDAQQEGYWFWIDGTRFRYAFWCRGEPNNLHRREHCMHMNFTGSKCMNDIPCNYRYPFVCVRK